MARPLSALVVGAGAVGQVFARHLQLADAHVTFFVREHHRAEATRGFDLVRISLLGRRERFRLDGCAVVTTADEVARLHFDQVYLTIPSTGLPGPWLSGLVRAIGDATVVALTPGPDDRALLRAGGVVPERLVDGILSLVSYHAPLAGEPPDTPSGTTYFLPPGAPTRFSGPDARTRAVLDALTRGRLPARRHPDVPRMAAFPTSVLMVHLLALEAAGWSLAEFARGVEVDRGVRAARESIAVTRITAGRPPLGLRVLTTRALLLRAALWLAQRVTPFPLEAYLRAHFTKVGPQTRLIVDTLIAKGRDAGIAVDTLAALRAEATS